jgi:hypothetical protein
MGISIVLRLMRSKRKRPPILERDSVSLQECFGLAEILSHSGFRPISRQRLQQARHTHIELPLFVPDEKWLPRCRHCPKLVHRFGRTSTLSSIK